MEYKLTNQFLKDVKSFGGDNNFVHLLAAKIKETVTATSFDQLDGLVSIRGTSAHYRFKIKTDKTIYRIGIKRFKKVVWFACIDNNKKRFYKRFP
jgi:hypothetical protein